MTRLVPRTRSDMTRWDAFRDFEDRLNRIFGDWNLLPLEQEREGETWIPPVDLHEEDDAYTLEADLPGMKKDDIDLTIVDDVITLKGTRKHEEEKSEEGYRRVERSYGTFQRSFRIPGGVDADKVEARFEDGVLKVRLPKPAESRPRQIDVQVQ